MLIINEIEIVWSSRAKQHYLDKGYMFTKIGDRFKVKIEDLTLTNKALVEVKCDCPTCNKGVHLVAWVNYNKGIRNKGKYYCLKCSMKLYGTDNFLKKMLKNSKSFAQWNINKFGENFLEKYWDYSKNIISPYEITYKSNKKVWIKCQEKHYHGSYETSCAHFFEEKRCPYCCCIHGIVHYLDSIGSLYPIVLDLWSDKNKTSPYNYSYGSTKKAWWVCKDGKHKDFERDIANSIRRDFRCPECQYSLGEKGIRDYLDSIKIYFEPQKEFYGLLGVGNGNLSYDFYISIYNLLIEFQGRQHEKYIKGFHKTKKDFERQVEHDKRKKEYALTNNINLLEIWYYDIDRVEEILDNYLKEVSPICNLSIA